MAKKFLTALDLSKNELQNAVVHNLASAPSSPVKGQIYFNSTGGDNTLYWWDGSQWIASKGAAGATPAGSVTTAAIGDAGVVGISTNFAREDHKHGMPAFGAITAQTAFGGVSGNGSAVTVARSDHTHGTPTHDNAAHSAITLNSLALPTANVSMNSWFITNLGGPTALTDAATKGYVDNLFAGLSPKEAVRAATTANITLSAPQTVDGVSVIANDRVLVKDQSTGSQNGIYTVAAGAWVRTTDADSAGDLEGAFVFAMEGTVNADKGFICTTNAPITPGTTATTWVLYGAGQVYTAGNGLTLSGADFAVGAGTGISVAADTVALDTTYADARYVQPAALTVKTGKYAANVAAATSTVINHALNTRDVTVDVYRVAAPYDTVDCDVERTDVNNVTVRFAVAPTAGEYRVVVVG